MRVRVALGVVSVLANSVKRFNMVQRFGVFFIEKYFFTDATAAAVGLYCQHDTTFVNVHKVHRNAASNYTGA